VVAEGVEDNAQHYFLSTVHRCDLLQGYLYSQPVPLQAFEKLVNVTNAPSVRPAVKY
jgi:EAL domain-containing protein (putative c-di-GMP-specific phosphodiesterase class I)